MHPFIQEFIALWLQYMLIAFAGWCGIAVLRWLKSINSHARAMDWLQFLLVIGLILAFMRYGPMLVF